MRPRHLVSSTLLPAKPSRAGSRVSDATMVMRTTVAAPMARPEMKLICIRSIPSSEMTTVVPAKATDRPAVSRAAVTAGLMSSPLWSCSRKRVTMNRA